MPEFHSFSGCYLQQQVILNRNIWCLIAKAVSQLICMNKQVISNNLLKLKFNLADQKSQISRATQKETLKRSLLTSRALGLSPSAAASIGPSTGSTSGTEELSTTQQPEQILCRRVHLEGAAGLLLGRSGFPFHRQCCHSCTLSASCTISASVEEKRKKEKLHFAGHLGQSVSPLQRDYLPLCALRSLDGHRQPGAPNANADEQWLLSSMCVQAETQKGTHFILFFSPLFRKETA